MGCDMFTKEFSLRHLSLWYPEPHKFTTCQWKWPPILYVGYRLLVAGYFSVWLLLSGVLGTSREKWFIFLTNWTFLLLTLTTIIMAATATVGYLKARRTDCHQGVSVDEEAGMGLVLKMQWLLYNITMPWSLTVTSIYWTLLWRPERGIQLLNFIKHGANSIYVMIDLLITATPVRIIHVLHPLLYSVIYIMFSLTYLSLGGQDVQGNSYIYHMFDLFGNPTFATLLAIGVTVIGVPVSWLAVVVVRRVVAYVSNDGCTSSDKYKNDCGDGDVEDSLTTV